MGIITKPILVANMMRGAENVTIRDVPNPDAYGLAIFVEAVSEVNGADFYDGTLVIEYSTGAAYYVDRNLVVPVFVGGGAVGPQGLAGADSTVPGPQGPAGPAGPPGVGVWA